MRGVLLASLAFLSSASLAAASIPPAPPSPNIQVKVISFAGPPAAVTCGGGASARLVVGAPIAPRTWQIWTPPVPTPDYVPPKAPTSQTFTFSINGDGRVTDLKGGGSNFWPNDDQAATIASWRFAPSAPATGCSVDLAPTVTALAEASPAKLLEVAAGLSRSAAPALYKVLDATGDCYTGAHRRPATWVYPDTRPFDGKSVDPPSAAVTFDIDAKGATRNVTAALQHGDPGLAKATVAAVAKSSYFPGTARTGCRVFIKARPAVSDPPPRPEQDAFRRPEDKCDIKREEMNLPAPMTFPPAFGYRGVGGWAIVRFDVAPWGDIGAVEVLAAQPAQMFGQSAEILVRSARPKAGGVGHHGCVIPIIYQMPPDADDAS